MMRGQIMKEIVSNNLKSARVKNGLLQGEVAERLGVSRQTISNWETDPTNLTLDRFSQLAEIYNCEVSYFFGV